MKVITLVLIALISGCAATKHQVEPDIKTEGIECIEGHQFHIVRMAYEKQNVGVRIVRLLFNDDGEPLKCFMV